MDDLETQTQTELFAINYIDDPFEFLGSQSGRIVYSAQRARCMNGDDIGVSLIEYLLIKIAEIYPTMVQP